MSFSIASLQESVTQTARVLLGRPGLWLGGAPAICSFTISTLQGKSSHWSCQLRCQYERESSKSRGLHKWEIHNWSATEDLITLKNAVLGIQLKPDNPVRVSC